MTIDVDFVSALPGLAPHTTFTLDRITGSDGLFALRAVGADVRLFLLDPEAAGHSYRAPLTQPMLAQIDAHDESEAQAFVVVNPSEDDIYLNLRAPIIVHRSTGRAVQIILDDQDYPVRTALGT